MAKGGTVEQGRTPEEEALGNSITPGPAMPESSTRTAMPDHRVEGPESQGLQAEIWVLEDSTWEQEDSTWEQEDNIWEQGDISWEQEDNPWAQEDNTVAAVAGDLQEPEEEQTAFDEPAMDEVSGVAQEVEMTGAGSAETMESATQMTVDPYFESEGTDESAQEAANDQPLEDENPQGVLVNPTETPSAEIETAPSESAGMQDSVVEVEDEMTSDTEQDEVAVETVVTEPTEPRGGLAVEGSSVMAYFDTPPLAAGQPETEIVSLAQIAEPIEAEEKEWFMINAGMSPGEVYMGERINLDFQNIDISNVFRLLAEVSDLNIIVSDKVTGTVTMKVKDIPWDQALDLILSTYKLGSVSQGNVIRVAPLGDLRAEEQQRRQLENDRRKERQAKLEDQKLELKKQMDIRHYSREFIEKRIRINYAKASDIDAQITPFLTDVQIDDLKRIGETIIDERTNTLTVTDYSETIDRIERYIASVDLPTPQVLIETRIVEAAATFARELGVQWGANYSGYSGDIGYAYGEDVGTAAWTQRTGNKQNDWISGVNFPEFLVDLPAEAVFGISPAAVGVQVGRIAGDLLNLDLRLSAAEQEGLTKIISRPKVMSMDNVEAVIAQGREIPYTQVNPEGNVSVVWKEALLRATVTPRISPDERVHMRLNITNDDIDPTIRSSTGEPAISKQEASTEVLVRNGETVVIGGIFKETISRSEGGVPGLKDIPVIDWLFKKKARSEEKRELLIFMTPFIVTMGT
jgi:type IV pilus assembly protein PilQ